MEMNKPAQTIAIVVIAAGLGFFGGTQYPKMGTGQVGDTNQFQGGRGMGQFGGATRRGMLGGVVSGEILSISDTSITIKLRDGGSRIVLWGDSTAITKSVDGVAADLKVGSEVMVIGDQNTDGSVAAKSIQLRPAGTLSPLSGQQK